MTTFLLPCYSKSGGCWIEKVKAKDFTQAKQRFINLFVEDCQDIDIPSDWSDLVNILETQVDIHIGDIYLVDEF